VPLLEAGGFRAVHIGFISETPLPLLWSRLWGMSFGVRAGVYAILVLAKVLCLGSRQECLVVTARKRTLDQADPGRPTQM
jgi:hypothetical protein